MWGGGGGFSGGDGYRGKVIERVAYFLCMWTANRKAGGPRRELQKEKELEWVGFCP